MSKHYCEKPDHNLVHILREESSGKSEVMNRTCVHLHRQRYGLRACSPPGRSLQSPNVSFNTVVARGGNEASYLHRAHPPRPRPDPSSARHAQNLPQIT